MGSTQSVNNNNNKNQNISTKKDNTNTLNWSDINTNSVSSSDIVNKNLPVGESYKSNQLISNLSNYGQNIDTSTAKNSSNIIDVNIGKITTDNDSEILENLSNNINTNTNKNVVTNVNIIDSETSDYNSELFLANDSATSISNHNMVGGGKRTLKKNNKISGAKKNSKKSKKLNKMINSDINTDMIIEEKVSSVNEYNISSFKGIDKSSDSDTSSSSSNSSKSSEDELPSEDEYIGKQNDISISENQILNNGAEYLSSSEHNNSERSYEQSDVDLISDSLNTSDINLISP